jgi:Xaa-Pro aminopeptidase
MKPERLADVRKVLRSARITPYLISDLVNIRYLTGFAGSYAALVIDEHVAYLISDSRYEEYARSILPDGVRFILQKSDLITTLRALLKKDGATRLYLEEHGLPISIYFQMKKELAPVALKAGGDIVNSQRMRKSPDEIHILEKAVGIADDCFAHLCPLIKPGVKEWDIAIEIDYFYKKHGCRRASFDSIVAAGPGSSMPHYSTSLTRRIREGEMVMIDMGCDYQGYNSDLTRTIFVRSVAPEFRKIYTIVRAAQEKAIRAIKPGMLSGAIDKAARSHIADKGFGWAFGHSLGHGVGLEVHEMPALKARGRIPLTQGMVVTVEPGIYVPGKGGVRIEDVVAVTETGCRVLTKSSKEIIVL